MLELLEKLTTRVRARELNAHEQLAAAAKAAARGQSVDVGSLEESLFSTRQTVDDFRLLCEYEAERAERLAAMEKLAPNKAKATKLRAAMDAESNKFNEIRDAFQARYAKLETEAREFEREVDAASRARDWLLDYRNVRGALGEQYREAVDEQAAAASAVDQLNRRISDLQRGIKGCDSEIEQTRAAWDRTLLTSGPPTVRKKGEAGERALPAEVVDKIDDIERRKKRLVAELAEVDREVPAAQKAAAAADARVADLQRRLLQP